MIAYIFGASEISDYTYLKDINFSQGYIICADGGIRHIEKLGLKPDVIIGDFDSSVNNFKYENKIVYPSEKDDTDLGLALNYAADNGFVECIAIGCLGGRLDHTFAGISLLKYAYDKGINFTLVDEKTKVFLTDKRCEIKNENYKYISVFPFGNEALGVNLKGFKYPLENAVLKAEFPLGISNELIGDKGIIEVEKGSLIIMTVKE